MEVKRAGFNYRHSESFKIDRPRGSGDYLLLIIKTEAFAVLEGKQVDVPASSAIVYKKGSPQLYGAVTDKFINDWVHFDLTAEEEERLKALSVPFDTVIPLREGSALSGFIKSIVFERYSQNPRKKESAELYFWLIMLKLSETLTDTNSDREHPLYGLLSKLRNEIQLEPQMDWSIDAICKKTTLSRSYVQHLYKQFFSTSITSDVKRGRIERAKYLLSASNMTVTAISDACGYESDVHFMRVFKTEVSLTPSEFRSKYKIYRD